MSKTDTPSWSLHVALLSNSFIITVTISHRWEIRYSDRVCKHIIEQTNCLFFWIQHQSCYSIMKCILVPHVDNEIVVLCVIDQSALDPRAGNLPPIASPNWTAFNIQRSSLIHDSFDVIQLDIRCDHNVFFYIPEYFKSHNVTLDTLFVNFFSTDLFHWWQLPEPLSRERDEEAMHTQFRSRDHEASWNVCLAHRISVREFGRE